MCTSIQNRVLMHWTHVLPGKEPAAERRVCHNGDAELPCRPKDIDLGILNVEREWRVLDLHGRDRVDGLCAAESGG